MVRQQGAAERIGFCFSEYAGALNRLEDPACAGACLLATANVGLSNAFGMTYFYIRGCWCSVLLPSLLVMRRRRRFLRSGALPDARNGSGDVFSSLRLSWRPSSFSVGVGDLTMLAALWCYIALADAAGCSAAPLCLILASFLWRRSGCLTLSWDG